MNNDKLKQTLAKMLPLKIHAEETNALPATLDEALLNPSRTILLWKNGLTKNWVEVRDTELMHLCREARVGFTILQRINYLNTLRQLIADSKTVAFDKVSDYDLLDADVDFQIAAIAKVK